VQDVVYGLVADVGKLLVEQRRKAHPLVLLSQRSACNACARAQSRVYQSRRRAERSLHA